MTDWSSFPTTRVTPETRLWRVHGVDNHPAFFNSSDAWRFGPPPTRTDKFGTCYLGHEDPKSAYVEKYGSSGKITEEQRTRDCLSELAVPEPVDLADTTNRSVLGQFGVDASLSTGSDYGPAQELAANLFEAGLGGIRYRIRHDPKMELEAVALFGEPGEQPSRFRQPILTVSIPDWLVEQGREFDINVAPSEPLP